MMGVHISPQHIPPEGEMLVGSSARQHSKSHIFQATCYQAPLLTQMKKRHLTCSLGHMTLVTASLLLSYNIGHILTKFVSLQFRILPTHILRSLRSRHFAELGRTDAPYQRPLLCCLA